MKIVKTRNVKTPNRGTTKSAGIDFFIPNDHHIIVIPPHGDVNIPSGIHVKVPAGKALVNMNKSGRAVNNKLQVGACVIDEDYQGEIHLHVFNVSDSTVQLLPGEKIVQTLILDVSYESIEVVDSVEELYGNVATERGSGGFGSTSLNK